MTENISLTIGTSRGDVPLSASVFGAVQFGAVQFGAGQFGAVQFSADARGSGRPVVILHGGAGPASVTGFADLLADDRVEGTVGGEPARDQRLAGVVGRGHDVRDRALVLGAQPVAQHPRGEAARVARAFEESRVPAPRLAALPAADRPRFGEAVAPVLERLRELAIHAADPLAVRSYGAIP